MFVRWEKLKHFGNSLNSFRNVLDLAKHTKERPRREMNTGKLRWNYLLLLLLIIPLHVYNSNS